MLFLILPGGLTMIRWRQLYIPTLSLPIENRGHNLCHHLVPRLLRLGVLGGGFFPHRASVIAIPTEKVISNSLLLVADIRPVTSGHLRSRLLAMPARPSTSKRAPACLCRLRPFPATRMVSGDWAGTNPFNFAPIVRPHT